MNIKNKKIFLTINLEGSWNIRVPKTIVLANGEQKILRNKDGKCENDLTQSKCQIKTLLSQMTTNHFISKEGNCLPPHVPKYVWDKMDEKKRLEANLLQTMLHHRGISYSYELI